MDPKLSYDYDEYLMMFTPDNLLIVLYQLIKVSSLEH